MKRKLPRHIAIIMDGNGRWARKRGLPRLAGHRAGIKSVRAVVEACVELGIEVLTLYAFSVENWKRPKMEINFLMRNLGEFLVKERDELNRNDIRLMAIGRLEALPYPVRGALYETIEATKANSGLILNLALNYGGRQELIDATKRIIEDTKKSGYSSSSIDENFFARYLYTAGLPDPDLLIRTSGEQRISNFLLWQMSYAEIYVTPKLWPDFRKRDLVDAIDEYNKRERRFGGLGLER